MTDSTRMLHLLQARARLREQLPILPVNENGTYPFCYPALEGYLYAVLLAPYEIDMEVWGYHLDLHLPDSCYETDGYRDDIVDVYEDIQDALMDGQYFKTHTLSIPDSIPKEDFPGHPLNHWRMGFLSGFNLVETDMKTVHKKIRKTKAFQQMKEAYVTMILKLLVLLTLKIRVDGGSTDSEHAELCNDPMLKKPLDDLFLLILESIHTTSIEATDRLEQLL
ncbi:MAG: UPF0149 family protein [Kiritimatiellia bacterium]